MLIFSKERENKDKNNIKLKFKTNSEKKIF